MEDFDMEISLKNPTGRKTQAHVMTITRNQSTTQYYFSYETCIAIKKTYADGAYWSQRLENVWGPTTGRHINELGVSGFEIVDELEGCM